MKLNSFFLLTLVTGVLAITESPSPKHDGVEARDNCFHPSSCSVSWAGKCEDYCGRRGFSHMTGDGCGLFRKKCCCIRS
ncbi:hypothetical protein XA68_13443 [Ophiocordyceps unilateralis]|uniref:Invertebrate defensins family profile domain-containing protein n=1 Tax=Ophiocordyceps unilateralis TaxID=268505 RepID=A0A2A9PCR8_OPHUN|nr:hypothetical protein XA68_13443 [Ophiocordyceps unilateralis]